MRPVHPLQAERGLHPLRLPGEAERIEGVNAPARGPLSDEEMAGARRSGKPIHGKTIKRDERETGFLFLGPLSMVGNRSSLWIRAG